MCRVFFRLYDLSSPIRFTLVAKKNRAKEHQTEKQFHEEDRGSKHAERQPSADDTDTCDHIGCVARLEPADVDQKGEEKNRSYDRALNDPIQRQKTIKHPCSPFFP